MSQRGAKQKRIRLPRFGSCIGLVFEEGGSAEMLITFADISRLIKTWLDHERKKRSPDEKTLSALDILSRKVRKFDAAVVAEVPIARRKAKIVPVLS